MAKFVPKFVPPPEARLCSELGSCRPRPCAGQRHGSNAPSSLHSGVRRHPRLPCLALRPRQDRRDTVDRDHRRQPIETFADARRPPPRWFAASASAHVAEGETLKMQPCAEGKKARACSQQPIIPERRQSPRGSRRKHDPVCLCENVHGLQLFAGFRRQSIAPNQRYSRAEAAPPCRAPRSVSKGGNKVSEARLSSYCVGRCSRSRMALLRCG